MQLCRSRQLTVVFRGPYWRRRQLRDRLPAMAAPTTLIVKLRGSPKHIMVSARPGNMTHRAGDLVAKDANGNVIARFVGKELAGWWPEPVDESLAERLEAARRRRQEAP